MHQFISYSIHEGAFPFLDPKQGNCFFANLGSEFGCSLFVCGGCNFTWFLCSIQIRRRMLNAMVFVIVLMFLMLEMHVFAISCGL